MLSGVLGLLIHTKEYNGNSPSAGLEGFSIATTTGVLISENPLSPSRKEQKELVISNQWGFMDNAGASHMKAGSQNSNDLAERNKKFEKVAYNR